MQGFATSVMQIADGVGTVRVNACNAKTPIFY